MSIYVNIMPNVWSVSETSPLFTIQGSVKVSIAILPDAGWPFRVPPRPSFHSDGRSQTVQTRTGARRGNLENNTLAKKGSQILTKMNQNVSKCGKLNRNPRGWVGFTNGFSFFSFSARLGSHTFRQQVQLKPQDVKRQR